MCNFIHSFLSLIFYNEYIKKLFCISLNSFLFNKINIYIVLTLVDNLFKYLNVYVNNYIFLKILLFM